MAMERIKNHRLAQETEVSDGFCSNVVNGVEHAPARFRRRASLFLGLPEADLFRDTP
jgi:hypothetical protein